MHALPTAALWARLAELQHEQGQVLAELRRRSDGAAPLAEQVADAVARRLACPPAEYVEVPELAAHLGISVAALHERLRRPRWRWLRERGEQHALHGRLRWERAILDKIEEKK